MLNCRPAFRIQFSVGFSIKPVYTFVVNLFFWVPRSRLHLGFEMLEGGTDLDPANIRAFSGESI